MNPYLTFAILFSLALLQSTVMPHITLLGVHPDLLLLVVTSWSLLQGAEEGMLWALIGGILLDLLSGASFGVCSLPLLLSSFLAGLGETNVFRSDFFLPILLIIPLTLIYEGMSLALLRLFGWPVEWGEQIVHTIFPGILINFLGMPIVHFLMRMLHRRTRPKRISW